MIFRSANAASAAQLELDDQSLSAQLPLQSTPSPARLTHAQTVPTAPGVSSGSTAADALTVPTSTEMSLRHDDQVDEFTAATAAGDLSSAFREGKSGGELNHDFNGDDDDMDAVDDMENALSKREIFPTIVLLTRGVRLEQIWHLSQHAKQLNG